ncbi:MAG TPA: hypothetical protein VL576_00035 [Candidatus Paceibacterota bacterium]|jgi:uncharacterized membrane protein|nr:hypothetical protein [Candidatus Paceibacterota bacterium]
MKFHFSIKNAVRESWHDFWQHPWFFAIMALVVMILGSFNSHHRAWLSIIVIIAQVIWGYVWMSVALASADGKEDLLTFKSLSIHMPNFRQFLMIIAISIISMLIIIVGLVLLIIPGLYFAVRLSLARFSYLDHQGSVKKSLEDSWHMVKGNIFWVVVLTLLMAVVLLIAGLIALFVGLLVAYPLVMMLFARLYRALDTHYRTIHAS